MTKNKSVIKAFIICLLFVCVMIPDISEAQTASVFAGGTGTIEDPYIVKNADQVRSISDYPDCFFELANDIDMQDEVWEPVCKNSENPFMGQIDGQGRSIKNLHMETNGYGEAYNAFIGYNCGTIKDINFENCSITADINSSGNYYIAIIAAYNDSGAEISGCKIENTIVHTDSSYGEIYVGAVAGGNDGELVMNSFVGSMNGNSDGSSKAYIGGLVGSNEQYGVVEESYTYIDLDYEQDLTVSKPLYWGALIGYNSGLVKNSFCVGTLCVDSDLTSKSKAYLGGIAGGYDRDTDARVENSYQYTALGGAYTKKGNVYGSGSSFGTTDVINVYYVDANNLANAQGTPLDVTVMNQQKKFYGFDFDEIWTIDAEQGNGFEFPQLKKLPFESEMGYETVADCVVADIEEVVFTGSEQEPELEVSCGGKILKQDYDYSVEYYNNINAGKATAIIVGHGVYYGTQTVYFEITPADINTCNVMIDTYENVYDGTACTPEIVADGLVKGTDYVLTYTDNTSAGHGQVQVNGIGNYRGQVLLDFVINKVDISTMDVTLKNGSSFVYTGKEIIPEVLVGNFTAGKDFVVECKNNVKIGTATLVVKGIDSCEGEITTTYTIKAPDVTALNKATANLYGKYDTIRVSWTKLNGVTGYKVMYKKMYAVNWNWKRVTGSYAMLPGLTDGAKYTIKVIPYVKINGVFFEGKGKSLTVYTLKKLNRPSVKKNAAGKVKVTWNNINGETGYQISRSVKQNGTNVIATVKTTTGCKKVVKAQRGKTYYYKVRAYKTILINGKYQKVFGPWSKTRKFKCK